MPCWRSQASPPRATTTTLPRHRLTSRPQRRSARTGSITAKVDEYRSLLGEPKNGGAAGPQATGRREINWDACPAQFDNGDNLFPPDFFNTTVKLGAIFATTGSGFRNDSTLFSGVNAGYAAQFGAFSPNKIFAAVGSNAIDMTFRLAGTTTPALVSGLGAVFTDVDTQGSSHLDFYAADGSLLGSYEAPARSDAAGLSFIGVKYDSAVVARVRITLGQGRGGRHGQPRERGWGAGPRCDRRPDLRRATAMIRVALRERWPGIAAVCLVAACSGSPKSVHPAHVLAVRATDYAFIAPDTVEAGFTAVRLEIRARSCIIFNCSHRRGPHLRRVNDSVAAGDPRPAWATPVGGPNVPGEKGSEISLQLTEGPYALICYMPSPKDGKSHFTKGMIRGSRWCRRVDRMAANRRSTRGS